jgi:hypothetical protein
MACCDNNGVCGLLAALESRLIMRRIFHASVLITSPWYMPEGWP